MKKINYILGLSVLSQCVQAEEPTTLSATSKKRPNFVFIMADDMGYGDPTCFGGTIPTPNLDKMAKEGMKFTDFHSSGSVCSPSRAGLMTGLYQQRTGVDGVVTASPKCAAYTLGLDSKKLLTLPKIMSQAGYKTAIYGKWHLGYLKKYNPMNYGFDEFIGFVSGNIDYLSHYDRMGTYDWWNGLETFKEKGYSTHLITKHAVEFIKENKDKEFCLYVAHEAVHAPLQGPNDAIKRGPDRVKGKKGRPIKEVFKDMLQEMDKGVGQVLAALKDAGIAENTIVIFTSDNGPMPQSSPGLLRGRKGSVFEGGHRVPTIAWWPGTIKAGSVTATTAIGIDILPTFMDIANISTPKDHCFDGVSIKPVLLGGDLPPRKLFWRIGGLTPHNRKFTGKDTPKAIRDGKWKLVATPYYEELLLFDLENDLAEKNNLAEKYPERVEAMRKELVAWETEMLKTLPYKILPQQKNKIKNQKNKK